MRHYYNDVLKPITSKIKVYKIASYDIETYDRKLKNRHFTEFLLGGFIGPDGIYKSFTNRKEMIKYMDKHLDEDTLLFATNNMFDYQALYSKEKDYVKYSPLIRGGRIIISNYHDHKGYDTFNYVAKGVAELGKILGKKKGEYDVTKTKALKYMSKYELWKLRQYNKRDCEITREFMIQFQQVLNDLGGELKSTIGSCAMDLYRRRFLKQNIYKEHCKEFSDKETVKEFIFRGYRGGRTETFKRGDSTYANLELKRKHKKKITFQYYDFNSMYAHCMRGEFPWPSSARIIEHRDGIISKDYIMNYHGMSECEVIVPYMKYPLLPTTIKFKGAEKLCFPIGRFKDVFTHGELQEAVRIGCKITKVYKTLYYTETFNPFDEWVEVIYGKRLEAQKSGNAVYDTVYKNILVNLYGKFGTHKLAKFELFDITDTSLDTTDVLYDEELNLSYKETPIECDQAYIFPIFASTVTMKGRIMIHREIVKLKAIFCDTDSVITDQVRETSDRLGDMKCEDTSETMRPIKPKWYSYYSNKKGKWIYKLKGMQLSKNPRKATTEYNKAVNGKEVRQWKFLKMKESLMGHGKPNERVIFTKRMTTSEDKRVWLTPYNKKEFQDSEPIILGYKNIDELNEAYLKT